MSSTTPVSEMDVFLGRIGHLSKTKNLIGPEFEGQKKISVFGVVPISWLIFIGICCSFFNKDAARSVTFLDALASLGSMLESHSLINVFEILSNLGHIFRLSSGYAQGRFKYVQSVFR